MKKLIVFTIMILFISVNVIPITSTIVGNKPLYVREIDIEPCYLESNTPKVVTLDDSSKMGMSNRDSYIIYDTEYDDFHPTLAGDTKGRFFACFELSIDGFDYYPDFWYSLDEGMTWEEAGYFSESLDSQFPDVDANKFGFYVTFGGPEIDRGQVWLVDASDIAFIQGYSWAFSSSGFDDFVHNSISCYTKADAEWDWGGMAGTCYNGYAGNDLVGCPFIFYPADETYRAYIEWISDSKDYLHSDFTIDEVTDMSYAVYDNEVNANLLVRKDNLGARDAQGRHPLIDAWYIGNNVTPLRNPSIEAHGDVVFLVCEEEGDIVCIYSKNGFSSVQKSTVVTSAQYPEVKVTYDGELFFCSYVKDDILCRRISEDGGATWVDEMSVDGDVNNEFGCHDLARGIKGISFIWEDTRGGDIDIYFGPYVIPPPFFEITSIRGPIGIQVELLNNWSEDLNYIEWNIKVKRGLIFYGREKTGIIETLPSGNRTKISSSVFGIGHIKITVNAESSEGCSDEGIIWARIVGPFTFWFHK
jgi:hypothetical protein